MKLLNIFDRAQFSKDDEKKVRDLLATPEMEQILGRVEQTAIDERAALRKQLDNLDAKHDQGIADATEAMLDADRKRDALRDQHQAAKVAASDARTKVMSLEAVKSDEDYKLRKELIATRDTRVDTFREHLYTAWDRLRHLCSIDTTHHKNVLGGMVIKYITNTDKVNALRDLLKQAMDEVEPLALLPLSRAEVTERLTGWTHLLEARLDAFSISCPRIDENGEVTLHRPAKNFIQTLEANSLATREDHPDVESPKPGRRLARS